MFENIRFDTTLSQGIRVLRETVWYFGDSSICTIFVRGDKRLYCIGRHLAAFVDSIVNLAEPEN